MICRLSGILEEIQGLTCVIQPEGHPAAYEVMVPGYLAQALAGSIGRGVRLFTMESLEAHGQGTSFVPRIVGFGSAGERRFFEVFTTVKGLGTKRALRALAVPPPRVAGWIASKDAAQLRTLPEIGPRLAETIIAELRGKVDAFLDPGADLETKPLPVTSAATDAAAALSALGEKRDDAERLVRDAVRALPAEANADAILAHVFARLGR